MLSAILKHPVILKTLIAEMQPIHRIARRYFKYNTNIFLAGTAAKTCLASKRFFAGSACSASFLKADKLPKNLTQHRQMSFDVNLNVQNNVILYKYENKNYFRNMRIFIIGQLIGWSVLAVYSYTPKFFDIFTTDKTFLEYIRENGLRLGLFWLSLTIGIGMYLMIHLLLSRTIKYIILNKGGKTISLVTYNFWKKDSVITVPTGTVRSYGHRTDIGMQLAIKVQEKWFFYLADKKGTFVNPKLFDFVMG
ncbi:transmembrane protein 223 [Pseudomyrmex gracilis]|uniref:transmembrane protein 223 n=1 Tax=Pseudomyrmex gracilis TaxID=219809 RepID=UPI0009951E37|nr:transmembrane protein 223 [Pseudomyrmex gracilis]XP_020289701.1 transmembrane protein 223 [Pseudomyrmex gracilis]XP_020289702.1 transmembrane protein 223 [Pseudomyrmex gracilis]XP_020289703.1 transmembrane protein 223 [Pseudomyrmex gracilis]